MLDRETKKYIDDSFNKLQKQFNFGFVSPGFVEDVGGYGIIKKNGKYHIVADYLTARLGGGSVSGDIAVDDITSHLNYVLEGYPTGRCVYRVAYVMLYNDGTGPVKISVNVDPVAPSTLESFNHPNILRDTSSAMESGDTSNEWGWTTTKITMNIAENIIHAGPCSVSASDVENSDATAIYRFRTYVNSGNLIIIPYKIGNNIQEVNWNVVLSNAGDAVFLKFSYITST